MSKQLNLFPETEKQIAEKQMIKIAKQPNSNGKLFQKAVKDDEAEYKNLVQAKKGNPAPKVRQENEEERINRILYEFDDTGKAKKPAHYNNPNIVKFENWKRKPEPFRNDDASTYPSDIDQRQKLSTWDLMVKVAKTPLEKKEIRETLKDHYKKHGPGLMDNKELRMIGKHPDQLKAMIAPIVKPSEPVVVAPRKPQIPIEELIRRKADEKLYKEQQQHDMAYGKGGLASLTRPK